MIIHSCDTRTNMKNRREFLKLAVASGGATLGAGLLKAGLSALRGCAPRDLPYSELRRQLEKGGVCLV